MITKVSRLKLNGYSKSEIKTLLKRLGFKVPKSFFKNGCVAEYKNRKYRFRHWGDCYTKNTTFVVDIGTCNQDFDRWANSTERCITFDEFLTEFGVYIRPANNPSLHSTK